jgi:hypothetical protein
MSALYSLLLTPMQKARLKSLLAENSHGGEYPQEDCALCEVAKKLEDMLSGEPKKGEVDG